MSISIIMSCAELIIIMMMIILQYRVSHHDLSSHTLWLSVWDWDRFGRNQFLGEIRLPLSTLDLSDSTDQWYTLHDQVCISHEVHPPPPPPKKKYIYIYRPSVLNFLFRVDRPTENSRLATFFFQLCSIKKI